MAVFSTVLPMFMAFAFLGEPIGAGRVAGTALVIGGVLWIGLKREAGSAVR